MNKIILASSSPRRKELLEREGIDFIIDASSIKEVLDESLDLEDKLIKLAIDKAKPIHNKYPNDVVISADTTVYFDNQIIGKAKDREDAKRILSLLSNHTHCVYSAVCIYFGDECQSFIERTDVTFKDITSLLEDYLDSNDWLGKAGAYGIQGKADIFVENVKGDKDNVIGLPVTKVKNMLIQRKVIV